MKTKNDFELIEAFFDDDLSTSEKEIFSEKLKKDPVFAKDFKFRQTMAEQLRKANNYQKTKNNVANILSARKTISLNSRAYYAIAASIIILLGIFIIIKQYNIKEADNLALQENDSTEYLTSEIDEIPEKANIYIYNELTEFTIKPGQLVEILNYNRQTRDTSHLLNLNVFYVTLEDGLIDTIYFPTKDSISVGKYIYLNDSIIEGRIYWKLRSSLNTSQIELILRDSLRNKI